MNTILLQKCEEFIQEVLGFFTNKKVRTIEEMETTLKETTNNFIVDMISTYLKTVDQTIVDDKSGRKNKGISIERRNDKRQIFTVFGPMQFGRT